MRRKITFIILLLLFSVSAVFAQSVKISGKVTDQSGLGLPGVTVRVKGTSNAVSTNADGVYSITAAANATLSFSFIGYVVQDKPIGNQNIINIVLLEDSKVLNDVVVVGYGTQKASNVSGAVSVIKSADIEKVNAVRVEDAIQGRASGVNVIQSGSPGTTPTVLIRGIPSYAGSDPLVVIDGVQQSLTDFNSISPADVESITVLKDAATTAIYGVKGGNGVIVITTKGGKNNQKTQFSISSNYGVQQVVKTIDVLNGSEYAAMINEGSTLSGGRVVFPNLSTIGVGTNWQDQIFKNAPLQSHSVSATGGSDKVTYFLSAGYVDQAGIVGGIDKSNYVRGNFRANLSFQLTPKLKFIVNTNAVLLNSKGVKENAFNSIIGDALNFDPTVPLQNTVANTVGQYGYSNLLLQEVHNPLTDLANTYNKDAGNKLDGKFEFQYDVVKNLKLTSRFGYTDYNDNSKSFNPLAFYGPLNVDNTMNADGSTVTGDHNSVTSVKSSNFNWRWESFANYNFNIKKDNHFETVLGITLLENTGNQAGVSRQDVPFNSWTFADYTAATGVNTATNTNAQTGYYYEYTAKNISYFGRLNYDYKERYLLSGSLRRDGSYAFGADKKFGTFYAGSAGWIISNEDFFHSKFVNFLKIRISYGSTGNDGNTSPQTTAIVTGGPYNNIGNSNGYNFGNVFTPGSTVGSQANPNLAWEVQKQFDAGFDVNFFKNKFSLTADYFQKNVNGLLFTPSQSLYLGTVPAPLANIGSTSSKGIDATFGYKDNLSKNLRINTSATFTTSKNKVVSTNSDNTARIIGGSYFNGQSQSVTVFEAGQTPGYFYGYKTDGLFQTAAQIAASPTQAGAQPGDIKYKDINGDGVIDSKDQTKIGDPFPKFTLGWNLNLTYKNFDFSAFVYASIGNDIYIAYLRNGNYTNNVRAVLGRWTGPGTTNDARYPRYSFTDANNNARVSDRYVEDGSFAKVKNLQLGYTFPQSITGKVFNTVRVYGQVKNAYTLTKYTGYDPEISGGILNSGVDYGAYPQARTFSFGLDLKF
ncbi:TonB-linked SusC/RagA family outer membrane protein [Mucilaginibacter gracilis]|uniref:TonB-linked SusC/RagA family outer membrane protein n=1 Tax=Mucilaginibacter gracilis TaxID=423350 RepID=A0A495J6E8_9SPHI|nr:TonB-dependent receptor [Mucilaginibacter gracilis]RKR84565.1 TonB-linked SusC/RagA family outer membrane protein [Mucilaginibacter gracilis]